MFEWPSHKRRFPRSTDRKITSLDHAIFSSSPHCGIPGTRQRTARHVSDEVLWVKSATGAQLHGGIRSTEETQALDGAAFIEAKRKKRANAFAADDRR